MREPYGEGVATHTDPESCGPLRKGRAEALTGARAGRVLSRESRCCQSECRRCRNCRKAMPWTASSRVVQGLRAVGDPVHVRKLLAQELGEPMVGLTGGCQVRAVNPDGIRRR